jgi:hypothetical protein
MVANAASGGGSLRLGYEPRASALNGTTSLLGARYSRPDTGPAGLENRFDVDQTIHAGW